MHEKYLGDSYDLVKRLFCQSLGSIATLYAHPKFVPSQMREKYTKLTTIPIYDQRPEGSFGILLDPDTGIALGSATRKHVSLRFIIELNNKHRPDYIICFDQSAHRKHELSREGQRGQKMKVLQEGGLASFYYASHAPFLFAAQDENKLRSVFERLTFHGIPKERFEPSENFGNSARS